MSSTSEEQQSAWESNARVTWHTSDHSERAPCVQRFLSVCLSALVRINVDVHVVLDALCVFCCFREEVLSSVSLKREIDATLDGN